MAFTILQTPDFIQSAGNPMYVSVRDTNYQVGQLFYCEIWGVSDKNMRNILTPKTTATLLGNRPLIINGPGDGTARFDISSTLNNYFIQDDYQTQPTLNPLQCAKDESSYLGYYYKLGYITYNAQNQQVKTQMFELPLVQWVVRASLPLAQNNANNFNSGNLLAYCYRHDYEPVKYSTSIPEGTKRNRSEDTLLPFFCPYKDNASGATLQASVTLYFADNTSDGFIYAETPMTSGGMFVVNAYPGQFSQHLKYQQLVSYTVTVQYYDDQDPAPQDITKGRSFKVSKDMPFPHRVLFMNRLGGWDSLQFRKDADLSFKPKSAGFHSSSGNQIYNVDITATRTYYSSYLTAPEFTWLVDLKSSPVVYLDGEYVLQQDSEMKLDSALGFFSYELNVAPAYDENTITL